MRSKALAACIAAVAGVMAAGPAVAGHRCGGDAIECYEKVRHPDVYATRARPVVVRPAYHEVVTRPAVYGRVRERVLVTPPSRVYTHIPAVTRTVHETVVIHPGGTRWEHRRGLFGREKLCKVRSPAVTRTIAREILVRPGRNVAHVTPARFETMDRAVVVQPASHRVIRHAPVVGVAHERVLVRRGGDSWVPSGRHHHHHW